MADALTNTFGRLLSSSIELMCSTIVFVVLTREAMISPLIFGSQRVLIGSPAKFTTCVAPTSPRRHLSWPTNAISPFGREFGDSLPRALSTSRVKIRTSAPCSRSVATSLEPTKPVAPVMATTNRCDVVAVASAALAAVTKRRTLNRDARANADALSTRLRRAWRLSDACTFTRAPILLCVCAYVAMLCVKLNT